MKIFNQELNFEKYEDKVNIFRRYQKYIYFSIIVIILLMSFFAVIKPKTKKLILLNANFSVLSKEFEQKRIESSAKEQIANQITTLKETLKKKQDQFFSENEFNEFSIDGINQLASNLNLKILNYNYALPQQFINNIYIYPFEIILSGNFTNIANLIYKLENFEKLIVIDSFNIEMKSLSPYLIEAKISLRNYIKK